jgi:Na+-driven multidrug efflux pump
LGHFFSSDDDVAELLADSMPLVSIVILADAAIMLCNGASYGLGKQRWLVILNLMECIFFRFPIGYYLAFQTNLDVVSVHIRQLIVYQDLLTL